MRPSRFFCGALLAIACDPDVPRLADLAIAHGHGLLLLDDGTVRSWGRNDLGQAGNGTVEPWSWPPSPDRLPTEVVGLTGVVQVASSTSVSCALRDDATVACWGDNPLGQVGDGTSIARRLPVAVAGLEGAAGLALSDFVYAGFACAPRVDGEVWCWGHACPAQGDGTNWCWGASGTTRARPVTIAPLRDIAQIVATPLAGLCARTRSGHVVCGRSEWYDVGVTEARALTAGAYHACALLSDRTVRCWGDNEWRQLGDAPVMVRCGNCPPSLRPVGPPSDPGLRDVLQVVAGDHHNCALTADHTVWCWGKNVGGMLGVGGVVGEPCGGTGYCRRIPARVVGLSDVERIVAGADTTCAIRTDGALWCWGWPYSVPGRYVRTDGSEGVLTRPVLVRWR